MEWDGEGATERLERAQQERERERGREGGRVNMKEMYSETFRWRKLVRARKRER